MAKETRDHQEEELSNQKNEFTEAKLKTLPVLSLAMSHSRGAFGFVSRCTTVCFLILSF